jgi:hypothetical protein
MTGAIGLCVVSNNFPKQNREGPRQRWGEPPNFSLGNP